MNIHTLLSDFAREIGLSSLRLDSGHCCAVSFGGDVQVDLRWREDAEVLCLATEVVPLAGLDRDAVVLMLLRANLDTRALGEASFALKREGECIALCRTLDIDALTAQRLAGEVAALVTQCRDWRESLAQRIEVVGSVFSQE
ncbi:type III secretion system chaperone [Ramlibacter sp. AN1015]|uniref:type III secretion system chaperone n=1 Tax=Ramlibacter sp. AN1015 TaxID=3133428 RepID=UPI0030C290AB